jgi:hypothetical protein
MSLVGGWIFLTLQAANFDTLPISTIRAGFGYSLAWMFLTFPAAVVIVEVVNRKILRAVAAASEKTEEKRVF